MTRWMPQFFQADQYPGVEQDVRFEEVVGPHIPKLWWHAVRLVDPSISVNNFTGLERESVLYHLGPGLSP